MTKQWTLTRVTKEGKAFVVGNPCATVQLAQLGRANAIKTYPGQKIVLRDLEAFKKVPVLQKDRA